MIYLNNAASSYPKPDVVIKTYYDYVSGIPFGQYRDFSGAKDSHIIEDCRISLARLFNIKNPQQIYFTSGATESANLIIDGLDWKYNKVIITSTEHNSVLRPLYNHQPKLEIDIIGCDGQGYIDLDQLEQEINNGCDAVFINHCSNVTGAIQNLQSICQIVKDRAILVLDASQSAGIIPISVEENPIDIMFFAGHKGLLGLQGTGGFYLKSNNLVKPTKFGGTGYDSNKLVYNFEKERIFEVGTQNIAGIASLNAAVKFILERNIIKSYEKLNKKTTKLLHQLQTFRNLMIYHGREGQRGPLFCFNIQGLKAEDVAYILFENYGIIVRSGLHCAPLITNNLGLDHSGSVRVSLSLDNTEEELAELTNAIKEISHQ